MIPEPIDPLSRGLNQNQLDDSLAKKTPSKEEKVAKKLFANLCEHAALVQRDPEKQLQLFPAIKEDCKKIHILCEKILSGNVSIDNNFLAKLSAPLIQIADQIEHSTIFSQEKDKREILNNLYSEINEIQYTIQLRSYLESQGQCDAETQTEMPEIEEIMKPLSGWHFQQLPSESVVDSTPSSWKLNNLKNLTMAALLWLGSAPRQKTQMTHELDEDFTPTSLPQITSVDTGSLTESMAKVEEVAHTRDPLGSVQVGRLRQEIAMAKRALSHAYSFTPIPEWPHQVHDQSYEISGFEQSIARLMKEAKPYLSIEDKEAAKCGPKHLNIIKQAQLVEGLKLDGIVVPIPHGIQSDKVESFLKIQAPELFEEWAKLGKLYANYEGSTPFLEEPEANQHLESIDRMIEKAFEAAGNNEALFHELVSPDFREWLETIKSNDNYLMVRSTGSEDSKETANAGGNVSRNYVSPNQKDLSKAMGDVVRSYFGYSSLQNRINAKLNPFTSPLKMAVTAQELIGEPVGGATTPEKIPISLVLFTSEPLNVGGESFRTMRISATYGHGEGVVGNQGINTDLALLLISEAHPDKLYILYDNKEKPERLAPVSTPDGTQLRKLPNLPSMQNSPVLDEHLLHRLYLWGVIGEKFFDDFPTDMEIIIKGNTIFPVQARPINRPDLLPTYIDLKKVATLAENPLKQKVQGEVIVPGKGSVITIDNPEDVLFIPTLEEAEDAFPKRPYKVVVVTQPEPDNSHPVVNFSGQGFPCLVIPQGVQELLNNVDRDHTIVVDIQRGTLNLWDKRLGSVDEYVSKGFAVHPAKIAISLPMSARLPIHQEGQDVPQEIKDLILEIKSSITQDVALTKLKELRQSGWLKTIKDKEQELTAILRDMEFIPIQLWQGATITTQLIKRMEEAFDEAESALTNNPQDRLRPLLHVKVIEHLINHAQKADSSLGQYSAIDITPLHKDLKVLVDYQKALPHPAHFADLLMLGSRGVIPAVETEWESLLKDLEPLVQSGKITQDQVNQFKLMIQTLETTGLLPTWFSFSFSKEANSNLTPEERFHKLLETLPTHEEPFLDSLLELHRTLNAEKESIELFNNPISFEAGWKWLQELTNNLLSQTRIDGIHTLTEQLNSAYPMVKTMALRVMQELVDTYDLSIKSMKASSLWITDEKVVLFKRMLEPYFNLLLDWGSNLIDSTTMPMHNEWPLSKYLGQVQSSLTSLSDNDPDQLRPSPEFSVVAAIMGSGTAFERHLPHRLEDVFTLIHQNLLAIITNNYNQVYDNTMLDQAMFPELLQSTLEKFNSESLGRPVQRMGFEINNDEVIVKYNVPLRNHAAQIWIHYDKQSNKVTFKGFLLGEARTRWDKGNLILWTLDKLTILPLSEPTRINDQELSFSWELKDDPSIQIAIEEWEYLLDMSLSQYSNSDRSRNHLKWIVDNRNLSQSEITEFWKSIIKEKGTSILSDAEILDACIKHNEHESKSMLLSLAHEGLMSEIENVRVGASIIFNRFFERKEGFAEGEKAANESVIHAKPDVRIRGFKIFNTLIDYNQALDAAEKAAEQGILDKDKYVSASATQVFVSLFNQGRGINAAEKIAFELLKNEDYEVRSKGLSLFYRLFQMGIGFDVAQTAATERINDVDRNVRLGSLELFQYIVDKNRGFDAAEKAAKIGMSDPDSTIKFTATYLLESVLKGNPKQFGLGWDKEE